jgi:uncharacterized membrane protein YqiK
MPALAFLSVVGLVLTALLFVADAKLKKSSSPAIVTSQRIGLSEPQYHNARRTLTNTPAPAPDMTSPAILAAQPTSARDALAKIEPSAREARAEEPPKKARAEASAKKARVEASAKKARAEAPPQDQRVAPPNNYQQTPLFDRFSIKGY